MNGKSQTKNLDIRLLAWGTSPVALLPRSLRSHWQAKLLPVWACKDLGLAPNSTMDRLGEEVWASVQQLTPRIRHFLLHTIKSSISEIGHLTCVDRIWPAGLTLADIGWTTRTRNALARASLLRDKQALTDLRFKKLASLRGLGAAGMLDFSATLEAAMDYYEKMGSDYVSSIATEKPEGLGLGLRELHDQPWADQVSREDPRFAGLLPPGEGTIRERIEGLLLDLDPRDGINEGRLLAAAGDELEEMIADIETLPLEEALLSFLTTLSGDRPGLRFDVLAARLGWTGTGHLTLRECSEKLGVTRERVRQIQIKIQARIPRHEVLMPQLDKALELLEENAPIGFEEASLLLLEAELTSSRFSIPDLLSIAELLGKRTSLKGSLDTVLVKDEDAEAVSRAVPMARKLARRSGASSVFHVQDALSSLGWTLPDVAISRTLQAIPESFHFLDAEWFTSGALPTGRDRLENTIRRMLAVASPQSVVSLRDGARRSFRGRSLSYSGSYPPVLPPIDVLHRYLQSNKGFTLDGQQVSTARPLSYRQELGETECLIVDVLRASPSGILDRRSLAEACLARGMNENTFNVYTSYSCVLEHIGTDLWKLRGVAADPTSVEAVRLANQLRPREKRVLGHEWIAGGRLRLAFRVTDRAGDSAVFGCPAGVRRFLVDNEFECHVKETGQSCGKVGVNSAGMIYGCKTYIQRFGLDANDVLVADFDIGANIVLLSVGYDELLEDDAQ